jgi:DNA gyrase subunit B
MWQNTTHDWADTVDAEHLAAIRRDAPLFAPSGVLHLVLEAIAYPADEAEHAGGGHCVVTLYDDGSVAVADDGRGPDTRFGPDGAPVRKPVMATKDLRFFDAPDAPNLPDGVPRRGMSVVAALSTWLVHTNHRHDGSWTQRYERGVPTTGLVSIPPAEGTGTTVHFMPDTSVLPSAGLDADELRALLRFPGLAIEFLGRLPAAHGPHRDRQAY